MRIQYRAALAALCIFSLSGVVHAEELSSKSKNFIKNFDANYGKLEADPELCGGSFGLAKKRAAGDLKSAIDMSLYFTKRAASGVPAADKAIPDVEQRLKKLAALEACAEVLGKRIKELKSEEKAVKARYFKFMGDASDYSRTIKSLVAFVKYPDDEVREAGEAGQLTKWKQDLGAVHALCTGEYAGIKNDPRYGHSDDRNPEMWCKAAEMREHIVKKLALNFVNKSVKRMAGQLATMNAEFEQYNGYLRASGMAARALFEPDTVKAELNKRFGPILEVAGLANAPEVWATLDKEIQTYWDSAKRLGPTWKKPKKDGPSGPASSAAKKYFKQNFKGDKVKSVYLTRGSWQIIKNSLGVPLRRTKPGYVLYSHKADAPLVGNTLCRGRSFTYAEEYTGRKYAKSNTIKELGYIRFEKCK